MASSPFESGPLDEIDRVILQYLHCDARNHTYEEIAEELPVTAGTVRNRIEKMEENGVIEGYIPVINYEKAGAPLRMVIECTAPIDKRAGLAEDVLNIKGVITVREFVASHGNVRPEVIAADSDDITRICNDLTELGLEIERETILKHESRQPLDHFGSEILTKEKKEELSACETE